MGPSEAEVVENLKRGYEFFNNGDFDAAAAYVHKDFELILAAGLPSGHIAIKGSAALREWMEPDAFDSQEFRPDEITVVEDKVLVKLTQRAKGKGSGIIVEQRMWAVWTFDADGLWTRAQGYSQEQEADARREAGLAD